VIVADELAYAFGDTAVTIEVEDGLDVDAIRVRIDNLQLPAIAPSTPREVAVRVFAMEEALPRFAEDVALHRVDLRARYPSLYLRRSPTDYVILHAQSAQVETDVLRLLFQLAASAGLDMGLVPLHASCLSVDGRGLLITASSGSGKSSLLFGMLASIPGAAIVTDDIVWLEAVGDGYVAHAANTYAKITFGNTFVPFDPEEYAVGVDLLDGEHVCRISDLPIPSAQSTAVDMIVFARLTDGYEGLMNRAIGPDVAVAAIDEPNTFFYRDVFHIKRHANPGWHAHVESSLDTFIRHFHKQPRLLCRGRSTTLQESVSSLLEVWPSG
jgi:hypothetical protein